MNTEGSVHSRLNSPEGKRYLGDGVRPHGTSHSQSPLACITALKPHGELGRAVGGGARPVVTRGRGRAGASYRLLMLIPFSLMA